MATFKIKDLSINIADAAIPDLAKLCRFPTKIACTFLVTKIPCKVISGIPCACTALASIPCGAGTNPCTCTGCYGSEILFVNIKDLVINPESIAAVREDLNVLMEATQKQSVAVAQAMKPATKAQAAAVKAQLTEALRSLG